ncbi:Abi-alpha family protein [Nitrospira lenta]|uniref:DUF4393 domain-containing protein n=1 Tax=Nitrospira lenta TaxID=1436998 RepID=A0A330L6D9_9BACT|nr:Abi-alpha family protein [Nitrospira lenta]SPP64732.1 hypothetical protein NITLEN_20372 [Nitrospira lenta]
MDDLLGIGRIFEAFERGTREFREVTKLYYEPIVKVKGQLKATELQIRGRVRVVRALLEADRQIKKAGIKKRTLNEKVALPILEYVSLETEDELIEKWAGLLASSTAGDAVHPSFPHILSQLSVDDAQILDRLYIWMLEEERGLDYARHNSGQLKLLLGLSHQRFVIATENLSRLKLCRDGREGDDAPFWATPSSFVDDLQPLKLTVLGLRFIQMCRGPKKMKRSPKHSPKKRNN